jgi:transcriptional regulator with XRE-family HTH domain
MKDPPSRDIRIRFGEAVRKRRKELNLSQEDFAERAELHRTYISDIERGTRNVSPENIEKLAKALDLTLPELIQMVNNQ